MIRLGIIALMIIASVQSVGQDCIGGAITSNVNYLYGRFEVRMQSAPGDGVVSSFFMYNVDLNCNWPAENNEIDVEMTGNTEDLLFTTHYPGPWHHSDTYDVDYNPHEEMHDYAFEWEPGIVRWFIDGQLVNIQNQSFVSNLVHPMRVMMNLWAANSEDWVGVWDPAIMPVSSQYDWVKYYAYTPGSGNYGTSNNFTFGWQDDFDALNSDRWTVTEEGGFDQNYCTFKSSSVSFEGGFMNLKLEEPSASQTIPVTFRVNTTGLNLNATDNINLNGSFNNWCGNCAPMSESNNVWTKTVQLEPGNHEFLFTKNFWEESAGAPIGSSCDFNPCDEYGNYGLIVSAESEPIVLDVYNWGTCVDASDEVLSLNVKSILEGAHDENNALMDDGLRINDHLPMMEPYSALGYTHSGDGGSEITTNDALEVSGNNAIVDWMLLEIRNADNPSEIVSSQSVLIQRDGDIVSADGYSSVNFENIAVPNILIAIKHRNHFGVRTTTAMSNHGSHTIDFTDPNLNTFGNAPMKLMNGKNVQIAADANSDGQINAIDVNVIWRNENGNPFVYSGNKADFNLDGIVNSIDRNVFWRNNNSLLEELD